MAMSYSFWRRWLLFGLFLSGIFFANGLDFTRAEDGDRLGESLDHDKALRARNQGTVRSLDSVMSGARRHGKVLDVELKGSKYKFKVLGSDGRVVTIIVDASPRGQGSGSGRGDSDGGGSGGGPGGDIGGSDRGHGGGSGDLGGSNSGSDRNEGSGGRGRGGGR
jgi:hypothetical protein